MLLAVALPNEQRFKVISNYVFNSSIALQWTTPTFSSSLAHTIALGRPDESLFVSELSELRDLTAYSPSGYKLYLDGLANLS